MADLYDLHIFDAEFVGGVAAGLMAGPLYGTGATWLKKLLPWIKQTEDANGKDHRLENQTSNVTDRGLENQTSTVEMQAPLYAAKRGKDTKLTATTDGASIV